MKKFLVVTPNWPPVSCPDLHRVRMTLPYLAECGWEALILKIDPNEQEGIKDPLLCRTVPESVRTWQSGCMPLTVLRCFGVRNVGLRSFFHLTRLGDRIIREEKPNVVFFSTTMFPLMTLGRYWLWRHGVPYVSDYQDPWVKERGARSKEHSSSAEVMEDKGAKGTEQRAKREAVSLKGRLADLMARRLEPIAMRRAAHVVSVSPAYPAMLRKRYPWLKDEMFTVLPFGAAENDYVHLQSCSVRQTVFDPRDGKRHWVYVGRGGNDLSIALRSFFKALSGALNQQPELRNQLRVHFTGTDYAPAERARKTVEPLAIEAGLADIVTEKTDRLPYFEALHCLMDADALIVPGSNDPGYTASKIYPYILARKPLLAIFHEQSSVIDVLQKTKAGTAVPFRSNETPETIAERILATGWLQSSLSSIASATEDRSQAPATDWAAFEPYTAREMTRRLCAVFDKIVDRRK